MTLLIRRRRRRYWVHPIVSSRPSMGEFHLLYGQMRDHPEKFADYFRMSIASFDELLSLVSEGIRRDDTNYRMAISPVERLVVTLRYLATGASYASLHFEFRLGKSTISYFVTDTCKKIWSVLIYNYMAMPTKEKWRELSNTFMEKTQFPNCLGAIDGKHIRMVMPPASGSRYFNYKKFSIVLMAVADANYNLISVDVGSYGSAPDSSVFQHSEFYKQLSQGQLDIPEPRPLPGTSDPDFPMVFVADEAFAISKNLMRPYSSRSLDEKRTNFNYCLYMARRMVECTFGILANKWRVLHTAISLDVDNSVPDPADMVHIGTNDKISGRWSVLKSDFKRLGDKLKEDQYYMAPGRHSNIVTCWQTILSPQKDI
ncbi:LOW QUALITY PROTEIN: uncharacterized protein ACMZJ9_007622 [Mantella aurantiaca]